MPYVLTESGTVTCHGTGTASLSGQGKLTVGGKHVLRTSDTSSWSIAGCTQTNKDKGEQPCTSVSGVTGGTSSKLFLGGRPALLSTFAATTDGAPDTTAGATAAGQSKLRAE